MAETVSPNPPQKQRLARTQSPKSPFFLGSNDDSLERAQARAARAAAAIRRKSLAVPPPPQTDPDPRCLDKQQILDLFHNCIKLASENKINQKNTWELNLIDHLCEIIKVDEEEDVETNFQKASCTLEAGVKIYSVRVDSVHSEAYKVLGGITRAGQETEQDGTVEDVGLKGQEEGRSRKDVDKKISPLSTLESSFEALNVKKFDVAFAVDPLYHQTSAQFDAGGAKGLLLNNLGVYGGCRVLFDSLEVPGKSVPCENQRENSDTIDLSFARDCIEQMVLNVHMVDEISPTLGVIVNQFDEDNKRPLDTFPSHPESSEQFDVVSAIQDNEVGRNTDAFDNLGTWNLDQDDQGSMFDGDSNYPDTFQSYHEDNGAFSFDNPDINDRFETIDGSLFMSMGFTPKQNSWAGPDHWKYRKVKAGSEDPSTQETEPPTAHKKKKTKKQVELDIDFTKAFNDELPDIFAPPKNPKSLLLPANRTPCNITLPEDCHYQPENLVKLFLLPNVMCTGKRAKRSSGESRQQSDNYGLTSSWDDGSVFDGTYDDGNAYSDVEDSNTLVSQPRQVNKIEVHYDKTSKQVDVQALKESLWHHIQESPQMTLKDQQEAVSFRHLLASFPNDCKAAATINDISPHLCFICLLHLANEHGLAISGCASLDELSVHLPHNNLQANGSV